jgi:regulatory protein
LKEPEQHKKKIPDKKTALLKAQQYCAIQERCQQEVRDKLYDWGLHQQDVEQIIAELIGEQFIQEERFAVLFAGGKFRIKKWGKIKIKNELKRKNISSYCIKKALDAIDNETYILALDELLQKKAKLNKEKNKYKRFSQLAAYAVSKGYETELVRELLNKTEKNVI